MKPSFFRRAAAVLCTLAALAAACAASAEKTVVLTFTGDCTLGSEEAIRPREESFDSYAAARGYDYFLDNFRNLFSADDLTVVNFEGVLSDSKAQESQSKRYRFRGPTDFVKILTGSSVEAAGLSNNHVGDYGKQGEESTKETLAANGIAWFQSSKYYLYEKQGIKIALFAVENKVLNLGFDKIKKLMQKLKESGEANAIVVCWHTGLEYRGEHDPNTERMAHTLVRCGADLIIMHHPHVLQGMDIYKNRSIFFSLGNFVFGGNSAIRTEKHKLDETVTSQYCAVVQAKLTFTNDGDYLGQQITLYPAFTSSAAPVNNYQPCRVNAEDAAEVVHAIQRDTRFALPDLLTDAEGLSYIEMSYLPAFDGVMVPEGEAEGPQWIPEASAAAPTRDTRNNEQGNEVYADE